MQKTKVKRTGMEYNFSLHQKKSIVMRNNSSTLVYISQTQVLCPVLDTTFYKRFKTNHNFRKDNKEDCRKTEEIGDV